QNYLTAPTGQFIGSRELTTSFQWSEPWPVRERTCVQVDVDFAAGEVAPDQLFRQRILDVALDSPAQRPCAVRPVLAGYLNDPVDALRRQRNRQLAIRQVVVELVNQQL